jgi:hypothetical protein
MPIAPSQQQQHFLGIDPGAQGGLVVLHENGILDMAVKMPEGEVNVWGVVKVLAEIPRLTAAIELVGGYTGEGQPGSRMFTFGRGYGALRMALVAAEIQTIGSGKDNAVHPQTWQKALGIPPRKNRSKPEWKKFLQSIAQQRFPKTNVTLWMADAILIADYCRRKELGLLNK